VIIHINKGTKWWEKNFIVLVWSSCLASWQWMRVLWCLWYSMVQFASCWCSINLINVNYDTHLYCLENFVFISSCLYTKTIWSNILVHEQQLHICSLTKQNLQCIGKMGYLISLLWDALKAIGLKEELICKELVSGWRTDKEVRLSLLYHLFYLSFDWSDR
jgi:hypothetical protein